MKALLHVFLAILLAGCVATPQASVPGEPPPGAVELDVEKAEIDMTCSRDSDCAVKNVGNCCGYFPGCVNKSSPTFPERVKAQCEKSGTASICGFREISACICVEGLCAAGDTKQ
jgi:hypothetical protein